MRVRERILADGSQAFSVDGSPTDAVSLAFLGHFGHGFDLVASGINYGANLGDDITYSGTVSAAMEAVINNCPAFAISQEYYEHPDFALAGAAAATVARNILEHGLSPGELVNVNVPAATIEDYDGFEVTRLGKRVYSDELVERLDPRGIPYFWIGGQPPSGLAVPGTDFHAVINRRVAVTPIHLDLTGPPAAEAPPDLDLGPRTRRRRTAGPATPRRTLSRSRLAALVSHRTGALTWTTSRNCSADSKTPASRRQSADSASAAWPQAVRDSGGLDDLLGKLQAGGLGDAADSWVGTGANQAVDPQALGAALGPGHGQEAVGRVRPGHRQLLPMLAAFLPQIIDMLTPGRHGPGRWPERRGLRRSRATSAGCSAASWAARGGAGGADLGGMLGGLAGRRQAGLICRPPCDPTPARRSSGRAPRPASGGATSSRTRSRGRRSGRAGP